MARWKLVSSHYLNVKGKEWEQMEVDQMTGQEIRKRYPVPFLLDTLDPKLWNGNIIRNPRGEVLGGDIVVALDGTACDPKDYIFTGTPTPDMFPLDDEAREISKRYSALWQAEPDEDNDYSKALMDRFDEMRAAVANKENSVKIEGLDEILKSMTALAQQNAQLIATLVSTKDPGARRL